MKLDKILPGLALLLAVCAGCKSQYDMMLESNDVDSKYAAAFDYFNQGKYTRSAALFESLSMLTNGTERDDTVQFYWALSNYSNGLYSVAETNFQTFLDHYPRSPFAATLTMYGEASSADKTVKMPASSPARTA